MIKKSFFMLFAGVLAASLVYGGEKSFAEDIESIVPAAIVQPVQKTINTIYAGEYNTMVIKEDRSLWESGQNGVGQVDGSGEPVLELTKIMDDVKSVSAGCWFSAAVKTDGSLWTWGHNEFGELGDGTFESRSEPVKVMDDVVSVDTGEWHTLAIKTDGSLWIWGHKSNTNTWAHSPTPKKVMDDVASVTASGYHTLVLKKDGSLWVWGENPAAQLSDGTYAGHENAVKVMDDVVSVSTGSGHVLAVKTDGSLWGWGGNHFGMLSDKISKDGSDVPLKIMDNVVIASAGSAHSMAVKTDGSLWSWGWNPECELGFYEPGNQIVRTPRKIMEGVVDVSAGNHFTIAVTRDGSLWTWGANSFGQLANGTDKADLPSRVTDGIMLPDHAFGFSVNQAARLIYKGNDVPLNLQVEILNGRIFYPVQTIFGILGADTKWNAESISGTLNGRTIEFYINSNEYSIDRQPSRMDNGAASFVKSGFLYVPVRYVAEGFGLAVSWDAEECIVSIDD